MKLSIKSRTYLYWFLAFISVSVILFSIYFLMGGFDEIKIVESRNNTYSIAGKTFKGDLKSDTLRIYFEEVRSHLLEGNLRGDLCVINYRYSEMEDSKVHQFIGILLDNEISEIPSGMSVIELESDYTLKAALAMHPLVRPNPDKVEAYMHEFAQERGKNLQQFSLEILYPDNSVLVEMFAKM